MGGPARVIYDCISDRPIIRSRYNFLGVGEGGGHSCIRTDRGVVSGIGWFWVLNFRTGWCLRMMSHGDVGVKNSITQKNILKMFFVSLDCLLAISDSFAKSGVQSLRACYYNINCVSTLAYSMTSSSFLPDIIGYIHGYYPEVMIYFPA